MKTIIFGHETKINLSVQIEKTKFGQALFENVVRLHLCFLSRRKNNWSYSAAELGFSRGGFSKNFKILSNFFLDQPN